MPFHSKDLDSCLVVRLLLGALISVRYLLSCFCIDSYPISILLVLVVKFARTPLRTSELSNVFSFMLLRQWILSWRLWCGQLNPPWFFWLWRFPPTKASNAPKPIFIFSSTPLSSFLRARGAALALTFQFHSHIKFIASWLPWSTLHFAPPPPSFHDSLTPPDTTIPFNSINFSSASFFPFWPLLSSPSCTSFTHFIISHLSFF